MNQIGVAIFVLILTFINWEAHALMGAQGKTCTEQRQLCIENVHANPAAYIAAYCGRVSPINANTQGLGSVGDISNAGPYNDSLAIGSFMDSSGYDSCTKKTDISAVAAEECSMLGCVDPVTAMEEVDADTEIRVAADGQSTVKPKPKQARTPTATGTTPPPAKNDGTPADDTTTAEDSKKTGDEQAGDKQNPTDPASNPTNTADASYDLQQAQQAQQQAQQCCNNPSSCSSQLSSAGSGGMSQLSGLANQMAQQQATGAMGQGGGGLQQACQMMGQLGGGGSAANASYAGICYAKMSNCTNMVQQFQSKYSSQPDVLSQLSSIRSSCQSLNSKYAALSQQSTAAASSGGMGDLCNQLAASQAQPSGAGAAAAPTCEQDPTNPACVNCNTNPENPNCVKAAQDTQTAGFQPKSDDSDLSGFNTPDLPTSGDPSLAQPANAPYEAMAANVVANNTGGGVPGGNGSPAAGGGGRGGYGGSAGYNTDVLHNAQLTGTGGFSGYGGGTGNIEASGGGGFSGYKSASSGGDGGFMGIDLKKYLPGHEKDPNRKPAGLGAFSKEIGPKYGDIFKRISDRMQTVCRFNRLLDCETK